MDGLIKKLVLSSILIVSVLNVFAQNDSIKSNKVYKLNYKVDVPLLIANFGYSQIIYNRVGQKYVDTLEVLSLDANDINAFDRVATRMDSETLGDASAISDHGVNIATFMPVLLLLDKNIRQEWWEVLYLYAEAHSFNLLAYSVIGPNMVDRYRPISYYEDLGIEQRVGSRNMNSFFSGHTSTTAVGSFFMAKVYSDFHPELGNKKYWLFAAAAIPPAFVGYYRIRAARHYPTDVIMGMAVGAGAGILVPHFHKVNRMKNLAIVPYSGKTTGIYLSYKF